MATVQACLDLDYTVGLNIRDAPWPLLKSALEEPETPWDLLFALALLDARNREGDPFWTAYVAAFLPPAKALTLPFCQSQEALRALQHPQARPQTLASAACKQGSHVVVCIRFRQPSRG